MQWRSEGEAPRVAEELHISWGDHWYLKRMLTTLRNSGTGLQGKVWKKKRKKEKDGQLSSGVSE